MPCLKKAPPEFTGLAAARRRALLRTGAALACLSALPAWAQADEAQPETSPEMGVETGAGMKAEMSVETGPDRPPAAPAAEMAGRADAGASAPESTENRPSDARQSESQESESALPESALPESPAQPASAATLAELRTRREADGSLLLTARVRFALAPALEQALLKGVPLHFMAEAVVLRSRWYWRDRRLAARQCYWRLAYLPLMRRWRVLISSQPLAGVEAPRSETTTARLFDTLDEALDAVQRVSHWRIMNAAHFEPGRRHTLRFHYLLQDEGLPRPLQAAERIEVQRDMDLTPEGAA